MSSRLSYKIDRRIREELQIAAAMAREEILEIHVGQLLELIQITESKLSSKRATETYIQLHSVDQETARQITGKTLAALGKKRETESTIRIETTDTEPATKNGPDSQRSLFARVRLRLSGGIYNELRESIELHTGRTQVALLNTHVENALRFVQILTPEQSIATAAELYHEMVNVRRSVAEIVYFMVLDRLSRTGKRSPEHEADRPKAPQPPAKHTLRIG
jgi:hypothetical protein